jgi:hypothetical protein
MKLSFPTQEYPFLVLRANDASARIAASSHRPRRPRRHPLAPLDACREADIDRLESMMAYHRPLLEAACGKESDSDG